MDSTDLQVNDSRPVVEFVEVEGIRLRVATQRGSGGVPLLIFNGIGRSEMSWRPRRFSGLARLTSRLLDRLGYPEVDVAGVSWSGALAQQFARQYPHRCRRLILAAT